MKKLLVVLLPLVLVTYFWWTSSLETVRGASSDHEFEYVVKTSANAGSSDTLPMVIALHGDGDSPDHFYETLLEGFDRPARFVLPKGPVGFAGGRSDGGLWPRDAVGLREYGDALADAVPVLVERYPTQGKPIVLGFSSGAFFAYYLAARYADLFSCVFPLSGGLPREIARTEAPPYDAGAGVTAFHGTRDQVVGLNRGTSAVESLRQRGLSAELVTFDGGHIDIFLSARPTLLKRLGEAVKESVD